MIFLNNSGLRSSNGGYKNGYLDEIAILFRDNNHIYVQKALVSTDDQPAVDSSATITAIYGIY